MDADFANTLANAFIAVFAVRSTIELMIFGTIMGSRSLREAGRKH